MSARCPRCGALDPSGTLGICPRCFLLFDEPLDLPRIAGLDIETEVGRGGMGRVFRARHLGLGRTVAVKVLNPELDDDAEFRARFEREARTLARLDHPGIVRVHDFGVSTTGPCYLVMEWAGEPLAQRLPVSVVRAVAITCQICDALAHAHAQGVVHRDIKPENLLIDEQGRIRLTDFGIARLMAKKGDGSTLTSASRVFGTPDYMAPEARSGARPDARVDVYAVGVLLQYLATGSAKEGDVAALPAPVAAIARRARSLDPAARYPSAQALKVELERARLLVQAIEAGAQDELPAEERSWSIAVALLGAVATAIALYAFVMSFTPRAMPSDQTLPGLVTFGDEPLPDGRILTRARFETGPILGAAVAIAVALLAYGLLRRHWRQGGLEVPNPDRPLVAARRVFAVGSVLFGAFVVRELLASTVEHGAVAYIPVVGGVLELFMLYLFWATALEAQRVARPLRREPLLWFGLALSLLPPILQFLRLVQTGHH